MKKINIGIIGLGRIGKVHLESLMYRLPKARVIAAASRSKQSHAFAKAIGLTRNGLISDLGRGITRDRLPATFDT